MRSGYHGESVNRIIIVLSLTKKIQNYSASKGSRGENVCVLWCLMTYSVGSVTIFAACVTRWMLEHLFCVQRFAEEAASVT